MFQFSRLKHPEFSQEQMALSELESSKNVWCIIAFFSNLLKC